MSPLGAGRLRSALITSFREAETGMLIVLENFLRRLLIVAIRLNACLSLRRGRNVNGEKERSL